MTSSPNVVPDPDFLAQCLKDSYEEMQTLAIQAAKAEAPKPVKARRVARKAAVQKVNDTQML
ncbi:hypothetical protein D3C76_1696290 [compost metagenome]